ncbi:EscI/YscI/HrpB family type III secretion system inner rod protein [Janthinobacterium agaricidamnosum]|uniref:Uncharacterized protein n=1 Tax=Janthinobacterium agaricidamnosum NBRC 102515 = DSM 9628 TaxID=1349767 RepID=W0V3Y8_9BURK|nr:EscI/YscI/HrpB family type III secretion system inner rod protein [Janthinobacterium agaricidamnosum]CDG82325.1 hypothetical protein GJA_1687 [Janthinobacterium agaricidamnosum NBRC 102515 = DSM 9628]
MTLPTGIPAASLATPHADASASAGGAKSVLVLDAPDGAAFRATLARQMEQAQPASSVAPATPGTDGGSLGDRLMTRVSDLASDVQENHAIVSRSLEQATRQGNPEQMMKAMMALNDYQTRIQFISKVTSKAISSLDQLTKLQ